MSRWSYFAAIVIAGCWVSCPATAAPAGTAFTYQGQLKQGGAAVSETCDMQFSLWNDPTSTAVSARVGGPIKFDGQGALAPVEVASGLFTVDLDFGVSAYNGAALFLEAAVRCPHSPTDLGSYTALAPRQLLTGAPYSLQTRGVFVGTNGFVGLGRTAPISSAEFFGLRAPTTGTNYGGMYVETASNTGRPFYGYSTNGGNDAWHYVDGTTGSWHLYNNGDRLTITSAGLVGIGTTTPDNKLHVHKASAGTVTADANSVAVFENSTNGYLSLLTPDANERGILFGEPSSNVTGGILYNSGGTPDGLQFRTNGNVTRMSLDNGGNLGIGTADAATPLEIALSDKRFQIRLDGGVVPGINLTGTGGNLGVLRIRNKIELFPNDAGTTAASMDLRSTSGTVNLSLDGGTGNLDANGAVRVDGANTNIGTTAGGVLRFGGGNSGEVIGSKRDAGGNQYGLDFYTGHTARMVIANGGNVGIGTTSPVTKLDVNGRTRTKSLEIVGGADLAEPFEIRSHEATEPRSYEVSGTERRREDEAGLEPGTVVVIDPGHPGDLRISTQASDSKVAGIISGAKGLSPGMVLRSEDHPETLGQYLVAMSGRVWCKCDTSSGAIRPGDLLTTSANAGHAMRVAPEAVIPRGAILGKAMSELTDGTGLVLVLVNLQ